MIPGIRTMAALRFYASRSYTFSRSHWSQENGNGFWTARGRNALIRGGYGPCVRCGCCGGGIPKACRALGLSSTLARLPDTHGAHCAKGGASHFSSTRMPLLVQIFHPSTLHRAAQGQVSRRIFSCHLESFPNCPESLGKEFLYTAVLPLSVYSCFTRAA